MLSNQFGNPFGTQTITIVRDIVAAIYVFSRKSEMYATVSFQKPDIDSSSEDGVKPTQISGNIDFREVTFRYPTRPDVPVSIVCIVGLTFSHDLTV